MNQTIQKISIPQPCQQVWQEMTPNNDGRHCESCSKTVIDFKSMTDAQLLAYLTTHNNVCGRFSEPQLDAINTQLHFQSLKKDAGWKKWTLAATLFGSTMFNKVNGQTISAEQPRVEQGTPESYTANIASKKTGVRHNLKREIKGRILDDANMPLYGATIKVLETGLALATDTGGRFKFHVPISAKQFTVSFVGFETETLNIDSLQNELIEVKLIPHVVSMNDVVVVTGFPTYHRTSIMGRIAVVTAADITVRHSWLWRMYDKYIRTPIHQIFY